MCPTNTISMSSPLREKSILNREGLSPLTVSLRLGSVYEADCESLSDLSFLGPAFASLGHMSIPSELKLHTSGTREALSSSMLFDDVTDDKRDFGGDSEAEQSSSTDSQSASGQSSSKESLSSGDTKQQQSFRTLLTRRQRQLGLSQQHHSHRTLESMPSLRSILENERSIHENEHSTFTVSNVSAASSCDSRILDSPASQPSYCSQKSTQQTPGTECRGIKKEMPSPPSAISLFELNRPETQVLRWDEETNSNAAPGTRPPTIANRAPPSGDSFCSSIGSANEDSFGSNSGRTFTPPGVTIHTRGGVGILRGLPLSVGRRSARSMQRVLGLDTRPAMAVRVPSMTSVVTASYDSLPSFEDN